MSECWGGRTVCVCVCVRECVSVCVGGRERIIDDCVGWLNAFTCCMLS